MSGLAIVQACLSLSFYKMLPGNMISRVFSINFIKRLEEEIKMSYSKVTGLLKIFLKILYIFLNLYRLHTQKEYLIK